MKWHAFSGSNIWWNTENVRNRSSSSWEVLEIIIEKEKRLLSLIKSWKYELVASKKDRNLDKKTWNYVYNFELISKNDENNVINFSLEFLPNDNVNQVLDFEWKKTDIQISTSILNILIDSIYKLPAYTKSQDWTIESIRHRLSNYAWI